MLQLNYIRENKEEVIERLAIKNFDGKEIIEDILKCDENRRTTQKKLDDILSKSKSAAKEIGSLYKSGEAAEAESLKQKTFEYKKDSKELDEKLGNFENSLKELLYQVPNLAHKSVPKGTSEVDNEIIATEAVIPELSVKLPHWELAAKYDIIDFDLGSKVTGAGFPFYKGKGAKLQRALINFFLDHAVDNGYKEIQTPLLVNEASAYGTGQLPDKDGQMYYVGEDNLYLIPTSEVPLTNIFRDVMMKADEFPVKITAFSQCFRREAGSYGKDVRGLNRLHQFDKVEIVQVVHPEKSYETLDTMREHSISLLKKLGLPYRVLKLCGGDISFTAALTFDLEVFSAAQEKWLEVSSVSNFEAYQANRLKLRFKEEGKTVLAHTLNGSALALPRILAALLENNQTEEGIKIPEVLHDYCGFKIIN